MGEVAMTGMKRKQRWMKRRAVSSGSHIESRRIEMMRPLIVSSCSEGERMKVWDGAEGGRSGEHGIKVGDSNTPGGRSGSVLGMKYMTNPPRTGRAQSAEDGRTTMGE
jgi:hypothetical protein